MLRGLVHYVARIGGKVKVQTALWSPQLTDAEIAAELADIHPVPKRDAVTVWREIKEIFGEETA